MITYSAAICAHENAKGPDNVVELLVVIQERGLEPDVITHNVAIAHVKAKQPHKAMVLLAVTPQKG